MTDTSTEKELQDLRAQVAELLRAQKNEPVETTEPLKEQPEQVSAEDTEKVTAATAENDTRTEDSNLPQLQELVDALEDELKETNPLTILVVFAIGILIGRLLPR